jgi:hypothetical protein
MKKVTPIQAFHSEWTQTKMKNFAQVALKIRPDNQKHRSNRTGSQQAHQKQALGQTKTKKRYNFCTLAT